jgi:hypothetical protein
MPGTAIQGEKDPHGRIYNFLTAFERISLYQLFWRYSYLLLGPLEITYFIGLEVCAGLRRDFEHSVFHDCIFKNNENAISSI